MFDQEVGCPTQSQQPVPAAARPAAQPRYQTQTLAQRTGDVIDESIRRFELQYIDRPIDDALIDSLLGSIRTYLGTLQSIVGYSVDLDYDYDLVDAFSKPRPPLITRWTPS